MFVHVVCFCTQCICCQFAYSICSCAIYICLWSLLAIIENIHFIPAMNAVHCMQSQTKTARRQNVNRSHFIGNRRLTDLWICIHIVVFCASRPNVHGILILIKDNDAMILDVINENENAPFRCVCVCGTTLPLTQAIFTQSNATGKVILYIQP